MVHVGVSDPSQQLTHPKSSIPPTSIHLAESPGNLGGKGDGVCPLHEGRSVAQAGTLLVRASGYGQNGTLTGSAGVGINININTVIRCFNPTTAESLVLEKCSHKDILVERTFEWVK